MTVVVLFALADALLKQFTEHVLAPVTLLYFIRLPYSDVAWIVNQFIRSLASVLSLILAASLVAQVAFKSREPFRKSVSAVGLFYPYSVMISWVLMMVALSLRSAPQRDGLLLIIMMALVGLGYIWLLWILGNAVSASSNISIRAGVLSGLIALVIAAATSGVGVLLFLIMAVMYLAWRRLRA